MTDPREISVFVASPDDVPFERMRLERVVARLNNEYDETAAFRLIKWEQRQYLAYKTFQAQIPEAAACDVVIVIFGAKLGTELPGEFEPRLPDGGPYPSGTAYELLTSITAEERYERPAVYVFRKSGRPTVDIADRAAFETANREWERLEQFFQTWFRTPSGSFRKADNRFADVEEFEEKIDSILRQWARRYVAIAPKWQIDSDGSPFRGLKPFDARHARAFFGRRQKTKRAIDELVRAARRDPGRPFLLIVGPSGSGKSSLARAGLIPRVTAPGIVPEVDQWRVAVMRPAMAVTPFAALAQCLYVKGDDPDGSTTDDPGGFGPALPELALGACETPDQLVRMANDSPAKAVQPILTALDAIAGEIRAAGNYQRKVRTHLLLLVDQLEEIFASSISKQQREDFARLLTMLADSRRVWIVATLRADLYVQMLDPQVPFLALKDSGGQYDLASPGEAELIEILQKSAEAAGLVYERYPGTDEPLSEQLLRDAKGTDTLPLLEFSLEKLFDARQSIIVDGHKETRLTFAAYHALGGLDGAIDRVAEDALAAIRPALSEQQISDALPRLLRRFAIPVPETAGPASARVALTTQAVALAEAASDEVSKRLVEGLVQARLLVSDAPREGEALLRLAHERILTSWARARKIIEDHSKYFHIRRDVDSAWRKWRDSGRRTEYLLTRSPLADAQEIARTYRADLRGELRAFISMSGRHAFWRQSQWALFFAFVAIVSTTFALVALSAERQAADSFDAAKAAADKLVSSIALQLREQKEIKSPTLDIIFGVVDQLIVGIQTAAETPDGFIVRHMKSALDSAEGLVGIKTAAKQENAALQQSKATMLYQFSETYHRTANDRAKALDLAEQSLKIWDGLIERVLSPPAEVRVGYAQAQMVLGDLLRSEIEDANTPAVSKNFKVARDHLELAEQALVPISDQFARHGDWARVYSQTLTKLGDLDKLNGNLANAERRYRDAAEFAAKVFQDQAMQQPEIFNAKTDSEYGNSVRELGWAYRKLGEVQALKHNLDDATKTFADEVCIRRNLTELDPSNGFWAQDLAYSLTIYADTLLLRPDQDIPTAEAAYSEAFHIRFELAKLKDGDARAMQEFVKGLRGLAKLNQVKGDEAAAVSYRSAAEVLERPSGSAQGLRVSGPWNNVNSDDKAFIIQRDDTFVHERLAGIASASKGCWGDLIRKVKRERSVVSNAQ